MHRPSLLPTAVAVCAALALTACSGSSDSPDSDEPSPTASANTAPPAEAEGDADAETNTNDDVDDADEEVADSEADGGATGPADEADPADEEDEYGAAMQERDQFLEDQQLPLDGSPLEATTPEQQEFIDSYREDVEAQGGTWNAEIETVTLALSLDACESAILAFHDVDEQEVETHILSSPLFDGVIPPDASEEEREGIEADLADTMVYGMQYLCPDDHEQWEPIIQDLYPEHLGS